MKTNIKDNEIIDDIPEYKTTSNGKLVKDLSKCSGYSNRDRTSVIYYSMKPSGCLL